MSTSRFKRTFYLNFDENGEIPYSGKIGWFANPVLSFKNSFGVFNETDNLSFLTQETIYTFDL